MHGSGRRWLQARSNINARPTVHCIPCQFRPRHVMYAARAEILLRLCCDMPRNNEISLRFIPKGRASVTVQREGGCAPVGVNCVARRGMG